MTRICNFPISKTKRCRHMVADSKPNCGRHRADLSADQLGQNPTVYQKDGKFHIWADEPNDVYCLIHSEPAYKTLYQVAGEVQPCCLRETIRWEDGCGALHRDDGPATIWLDGTQSWWQHGILGRDDGPAIIYLDGRQQWYQHNMLHRDDGPAATYPDGARQWWYHGRLHREDGPAWIDPDGTQHWYWQGTKVTEEEHAACVDNPPAPDLNGPVFFLQ